MWSSHLLSSKNASSSGDKKRASNYSLVSKSCIHTFIIHTCSLHVLYILPIVNLFVDLTQYLFSQPDIFFLSNNLCQDPLEKFLGQQRQRRRVNENPNVMEFIHRL